MSRSKNAIVIDGVELSIDPQRTPISATVSFGRRRIATFVSSDDSEAATAETLIVATERRDEVLEWVRAFRGCLGTCLFPGLPARARRAFTSLPVKQQWWAALGTWCAVSAVMAPFYPVLTLLNRWAHFFPAGSILGLWSVLCTFGGLVVAARVLDTKECVTRSGVETWFRSLRGPYGAFETGPEWTIVPQFDVRGREDGGPFLEPGATPTPRTSFVGPGRPQSTVLRAWVDVLDRNNAVAAQFIAPLDADAAEWAPKLYAQAVAFIAAKREAHAIASHVAAALTQDSPTALAPASPITTEPLEVL